MSTLEETWGREKFAATVYDFAVQNPIIGRVAAQLLWGFDIRKLFASIERIRQTPAGAKVLDVPCGGGLVFAALDQHQPLDYTALDFSPVMLARAEKKARSLSLDYIRFEQGDVGALPHDDESFDLCLTYNGIHCFPEPKRAVAELTRVLKPGGTLRGSLVVNDAGFRYNAVITLFQHRGYFGPGCSRDDLLDWLAEAGLRIKSEEQSGGFMIFEAVKN